MKKRNDQNLESILYSLWLPVERSNFFNELNYSSENNLVSKLLEVCIYNNFIVDNFEINLQEFEYEKIRGIYHEHTPKYRNDFIKKYFMNNNLINKISHINFHEKNNINIQYKIDTIDSIKDRLDIDIHNEYKQFYGLKGVNTVNQLKIDFDKKNSETLHELRKLDILSNIHINIKKNKAINYTSIDLSLSSEHSSYIIASISKFLNTTIYTEQYIKKILEEIKITILIDEFGFYFFHFKLNKFLFKNSLKELEVIKELIVYLFINKEHNLITNDQDNFLMYGLLFQGYDYKDFFNLSNKNINKNSYHDFFKTIMIIFKDSGFINEKYTFPYRTKKEIEYLLDHKNDKELSQRMYSTLPILQETYSKHESYLQNNGSSINEFIYKNILDREIVTEDKSKFIYNLLLQNIIEKRAIEKFLEVSISINYLIQAMNGMRAAKDRLGEIIIFNTTDNVESISNLTNEEKYKMNEEQITRYVELIFSKFPNINVIDTLIQEAYYIKVGNYSFIEKVGNEEQIQTIHNYITWKNYLGNIDNIINSLRTILHIYQDRQSYDELEEIKRQEIANNDGREIITISSSDEIQNFRLNENDKNFFLFLGMIFTLSDFLDDIWKGLNNFIENIVGNHLLSGVIVVILIILAIVFVSKYPAKILVSLFKTKPSEFIFFGVNAIEFRSKRYLGQKYNISHEDDHNFVKIIDKIVNIIKDTINNTSIIEDAEMRTYISRINPHLRRITIRFIFEEPQDIKKIGIKTKNKIQLKYFIAYNFTLKTEEETMFKVYNNTVKIYYNIGAKSKKIKNHIEPTIRENLYDIYIKKLNIH